MCINLLIDTFNTRNNRISDQNLSETENTLVYAANAVPGHPKEGRKLRKDCGY